MTTLDLTTLAPIAAPTADVNPSDSTPIRPSPVSGAGVRLELGIRPPRLRELIQQLRRSRRRERSARSLMTREQQIQLHRDRELARQLTDDRTLQAMLLGASLLR